jgi:hypothetical protein
MDRRLPGCLFAERLPMKRLENGWSEVKAQERDESLLTKRGSAGQQVHPPPLCSHKCESVDEPAAESPRSHERGCEGIPLAVGSNC